MLVAQEAVARAAAMRGQRLGIGQAIGTFVASAALTQRQRRLRQWVRPCVGGVQHRRVAARGAPQQRQAGFAASGQARIARAEEASRQEHRPARRQGGGAQRAAVQWAALQAPPEVLLKFLGQDVDGGRG